MLEQKNIELEKAVLIGIVTKEQDEAKSKEYLDELEFLTRILKSVQSPSTTNTDSTLQKENFSP